MEHLVNISCQLNCTVFIVYGHIYRAFNEKGKYRYSCKYSLLTFRKAVSFGWTQNKIPLYTSWCVLTFIQCSCSVMYLHWFEYSFRWHKQLATDENMMPNQSPNQLHKLTLPNYRSMIMSQMAPYQFCKGCMKHVSALGYTTHKTSLQCASIFDSQVF